MTAASFPILRDPSRKSPRASRHWPWIGRALIAAFAALIAGAGLAQPAASLPGPAEPSRLTKTSIERKGRSGRDILLGTYLTLEPECRIGPAPALDVPDPARNGSIVTRPMAINLREVPGARPRGCVGTSPSGLGLFYRADRRFKGEETITYRLTYPDGSIREVRATIRVE
jgi:hypothetical protein